ncbi:MAG: NAD(P)H-hydrate epimerase [Planctomycetes bacterium]|nr:NAD(P)H-hydrate epimerase [Planctomycetota bacterium]
MAAPKTLTREQCRRLDAMAIEEYGLASIVLMENAGRACANEVEKMLLSGGVARALDKLAQGGSRDDIPRNVEELDAWKSGLGKARSPIIVVCGPGNNGGDGLVIARTLINRGHPVETFFVGDIEKLADASADVRKNAELLRGMGAGIGEIFSAAQMEGVRGRLADAPVIVDALFGTGLSRALEDPYLALAQHVNESAAPVLAVDIPSGLDADNGNVLGFAIRATVTLTFMAPKPGFYLNAGPACCGAVKVAEIGIPRMFIDMA